MAATAVARVAFAGDCGGSGSSKAPKVAAAINAAFGRFAIPAQTWLIIGGDEYTWCSTQTMKNYDRFLTQNNISAARTVMTPGNHTNGPGGSSNTPDVRAWLAYDQAHDTLSNTSGGWIDQKHGIPLTDQYLDIGGIRFIVINSGGAINARPGLAGSTDRRFGRRQRASRLVAIGVEAGNRERGGDPSSTLRLLRRAVRQSHHGQPDRRDARGE